MATGQSEYSILMVDDEAQTLKYFRRAFEKEFQIFTASSADEGMEILKKESGRIAILVSDQRMPDKRGVELLKYARSEFPEVVRILTTGYTDLEEAIDAVNDGEIHRYITKPWDLSALQLELRQAMQFFLIRKERDELLSEKISAKQRLEGVVRVRELIAMASGFTATRNPICAVRLILEQAPIAGAADNRAPQPGWERQIEQIEKLSGALANLAREFEGKSGASISTVNLGSLLRGASSAAGVDIADFKEGNLEEIELEACPDLLEGALKALFSWASKSLRGEKIVIQSDDSGSQIELRLDWEGVSWGDTSLLDFPSSLLGAYFVICHHSGKLIIGNQDDGRFCILIALPKSAGEDSPEVTDASWLEPVMRRFENW